MQDQIANSKSGWGWYSLSNRVCEFSMYEYHIDVDLRFHSPLVIIFKLLFYQNSFIHKVNLPP